MRARVHIPATKPPTELIDGQLVQKLGGTRTHQALEARWTEALRAWDVRGIACHEWDHEFTAPDRRPAFLVPDVAYQTAATIDALGPAGAEAPPCAPEVAVEILSVGEPEGPLAWKIDAYLRAGTKVVFVVDPPQRTVVAHSRDALERFGEGETVGHLALPGFAFPIDAMFEGLYLG